MRVRHVVLRARRRCPTSRACRASGWSRRRPAPAGPRVWFFTTAGMAPGDGRLAELRRRAPTRTWCRRRRRSPDTAVAALGLSGVAAWMVLDLARAGCARARRVLVLGAGGRSARSAVRRPGSLGRRPGRRGCPRRPPRERAAARRRGCRGRPAADDDVAALAERAARGVPAAPPTSSSTRCSAPAARPRRRCSARAAGWSTSAARPAPPLSSLGGPAQPVGGRARLHQQRPHRRSAGGRSSARSSSTPRTGASRSTTTSSRSTAHRRPGRRSPRHGIRGAWSSPPRRPVTTQRRGGPGARPVAGARPQATQAQR